MTNPADRTMTSSGFYVSQEAPITTDNPITTPSAPAPDILRCAYMELVVTDLAASRLSLIHISEPTRRLRGSRMPSSA